MEAFVLVSTIYFQLWGMAMDIALTAVGIAANVALFYGAIVRNAKAVQVERRVFFTGEVEVLFFFFLIIPWQGYLVAASAKGAVALARLGRVLYKYALKSEWGKDLHNDQAAFATHLTASVFNLGEVVWQGGKGEILLGVIETSL